ncbi:methylenetetrahydrofolate reductase [NAD(P)H] [Parabacteroides sp. 52]|uniref:methylenetetrahydrofolate reductase [NAD(P)H] n=1 Tax=unclassified Parabacteroides TaxID=2649774 RepID=UPI0013D0951A|nr:MULTISPECIES: methylenetetrahydrofolate reductase [NAD(P)H] [unclassified Parabacteroides]MDH6534268.1 methylenetetrahydrofolate reductase (NADPH) [Parabacteroides sp. PM5-20]NDV55348.1 methylenetetrahydrofolate reductase [NAD(P)H] [Parabacteroides sp. 52]
MKVIDLIKGNHKTAFSFEILPPLKGNNIQRVYDVIDRLKEFNPQYINITSHHSEPVYKTLPDGTFQRVNVRKRPGSVAIASAIQNKYGIPAVPHIICKGFTKEETEYALIDLNFLGVYDLLLLRGDVKTLDASLDKKLYHDYATDLQQQVNDFNKGIAVDGSSFDANETPFSYGMACYPEKHEEAPNMESDIYYLKEKVKNGADYLVTQMFFDNEKYFSFVERCRAEGIQVPIIPGIKPVVFKEQLTVLPRVFRSEIPEPFAAELRKCKNNEEVKAVGVEWCTQQCKELIARGVPSLHFYTFMASDSVCKVAGEIY